MVDGSVTTEPTLPCREPLGWRNNMTKLALVFSTFLATSLAASSLFAQWPGPSASVIPEARGYVAIPNAAVVPDKKRIYLAIYEATRAAPEPKQLVPALNMAGFALNAFATTGVPQGNAKLVIVFRGPAVAGILDEVFYLTKFGVANPNLKVLSGLKKAGVEIFVCGQTLAAEKIDPKTLSPHVQIASAAQIVMMTYQNDGYAVLNY